MKRWVSKSMMVLFALTLCATLHIAREAQAAFGDNVGDCVNSKGNDGSTTSNNQTCPANPTRSCRDTTTCYLVGAIYIKYAAIRAYDNCGGSTGTCKYCPTTDAFGKDNTFICATGFGYGNDNTCNAKNKGGAQFSAIVGPNNLCPAN